MVFILRSGMAQGGTSDISGVLWYVSLKYSSVVLCLYLCLWMGQWMDGINSWVSLSGSGGGNWYSLLLKSGWNVSLGPVSVVSSIEVSESH